MWGPYRHQYGPRLCCIVPYMDHNAWMREHDRLSGIVADVRARRDELARHSQYLPGPVLRKRDGDLDRQELYLLDQLAALVDLDRSGAVS